MGRIASLVFDPVSKGKETREGAACSGSASADRKAEIMRVLPRNIHGVEPALLPHFLSEGDGR